MLVGSELRWILEGFTPDTIPMSRLAEYMQQLSKLLGQEQNVHFVRVEDNCVAVVSKVERASAGRVSARLGAVRQGNAPADAARAYDAINGMLAEDKTSAYLREGSAIVIRFPGQTAERPAQFEVPDTGSVVGYLYALSEHKGGFHARIRLESGGALMCDVAGEVARKLREHLFGTVKVSGTGIWARSTEGTWTVTKMDIQDVVAADSAPLRAIVEQMRKLDIEWLEDPLGYLDEMNRDGGSVQ